MKKIINTTKEKYKILDFLYDDNEVEIDYYSDEEDKINAVITEGMDITDFFHLKYEDLPSIINIDILSTKIGNDIIIGHGISKENNVITIKFYFDNLTDVENYKEFTIYELLRTTEKIAKTKDNIKILSEFSNDSGVYSMTLGVIVPFKETIEGTYFEAKKELDILFIEAEKYLMRFDEIVASTNKYTLTLPDTLKTCISQYLLFFEEFVFRAKGKTVLVNVNKINKGLEVEINPLASASPVEISTWLKEYVDFIRQKIENLTINFENGVSTFEANILIIDLKNQISTLKNSVEIANLRSQQLLDENSFLRTLALSYAQKAPQLVLENENNKKNLKNLIAKGNISEAINELKKIIINNEKYLNQIILLEFRFNRTNYEIRNGISNNDDSKLELTKIINNILDLIDEI